MRDSECRGSSTVPGSPGAVVVCIERNDLCAMEWNALGVSIPPAPLAVPRTCRPSRQAASRITAGVALSDLRVPCVCSRNSHRRNLRSNATRDCWGTALHAMGGAYAQRCGSASRICVRPVSTSKGEPATVIAWPCRCICWMPLSHRRERGARVDSRRANDASSPAGVHLAFWRFRCLGQATLFEQRLDLRRMPGEVLEQLHCIHATAAREQGLAETIAIGAAQGPPCCLNHCWVWASSTSDQM